MPDMNARERARYGCFPDRVRLFGPRPRRTPLEWLRGASSRLDDHNDNRRELAARQGCYDPRPRREIEGR